ncbi:hypothetical protein CPAR01_03234, partial [Colletotrichum paranaense]
LYPYQPHFAHDSGNLGWRPCGPSPRLASGIRTAAATSRPWQSPEAKTAKAGLTHSRRQSAAHSQTPPPPVHHWLRQPNPRAAHSTQRTLFAEGTLKADNTGLALFFPSLTPSFFTLPLSSFSGLDRSRIRWD